MTRHEQTAAGNRFRRALLMFRSAQRLLVAADRRLKGLPAEEIEAFWAAPGGRIERHMQVVAMELTGAFAEFSGTGQVAAAEDRRLVSEAERILAEAKA